ncbi:MAG: T9SS type A sorting domain-containing protein [Bacteroidetes bacterium]|nr:T9SS type A sorting domain-containing protein [Bacteroidota bacterium]
MKPALLFLSLLFVCTVPLRAQGSGVEPLVFRSIDVESCCFDIYLENSLDPPTDINSLRLRIKTPGVKFEGGAGGPWPTAVETDSVIEFGEQGVILHANEAIEGFVICMGFPPGQARTCEIEWTLALDGTVAAQGTSTLECIVVSKVCDSLSLKSISIPNQPDGSCCYELTLTNKHLPVGGTNGLRLVLQTPGAFFVGAPTGPWAVIESTPTSVAYSTNTPINSGASVTGFRFCIISPPVSQIQLDFRYSTSLNGAPLCESTVSASCRPVYIPRSDTATVRKLQDCSYDIGFINNHVPRSSVNGFRLSVFTPGASFESITAPTGWNITSETGLNVQFTKTGAPLANGDSAKGFLVTFKPTKTGTVRFVWTTFNGTAITSKDTLQVQCEPPPPSLCDSLLVTPLPASCTYDFGFFNKHQPKSSVNDFHIRLQNPGATIQDVAFPEGWIVESRTSTDVVFKDTAGVIAEGEQQTGFLLTLTPGDFGNAIVFEWCTSLDGSINCCEYDFVTCVTLKDRCDSLAVTPSEDYCSYNFSLTNLRVPNASLDAWTLRLDNPEAVLLAADAPAGWRVDTLDEQYLRFELNSGELGTGETIDGFVIHFVPSALTRHIPFTWCTEFGGQQRCCDTTSVACEVKIVQCDVIDVVTSVERACCFDFNVENVHLPRGLINGFNVQILTPGVSLFTSTISDPDGWTHISNSSRVGWRRTDGAIAPGETLGGFVVCYDNSGIGNADFEIVTQTVENGLILCEDTLTIKCDRTLTVELISGVRPDSYRLHQNYPNPFNPVTTITFDLPQRSELTLSLYDANGRLVMDLGSGSYDAGSWQITLDASALSSGTYHYQLRSGEFTAMRSLILLK